MKLVIDHMTTMLRNKIYEYDKEWVGFPEGKIKRDVNTESNPSLEVEVFLKMRDHNILHDFSIPSGFFAPSTLQIILKEERDLIKNKK